MRIPAHTCATDREGDAEGIPSEGVISSPRCFLRSVFSTAIFFPSPPGKERVSSGTRGLAQYIDRQHGEKLYRFERIPHAANSKVASPQRGRPRAFILAQQYCASMLAGGFHSATLATFDRSLRFRSTQSLPRSIRRFVEPPAAPSAPCCRNSARGTPSASCPSSRPLRGTPGSAFRTGVGCPPFFLHRGYPRERISYGSGVRFPGARIDNAGGNRRECFPARRWGSSSVGRAPRSQRGGRGFNPLLLHHLAFPHNKVAQPPSLRRLLTSPVYIAPP